MQRNAVRPNAVVSVFFVIAAFGLAFSLAACQSEYQALAKPAKILNPPARSLAEWRDPGDLVHNYCGIIVGEDLQNFTSHFTRKIFRGDPVADFFLTGLAAIGGNEWRQKLLDDIDYFSGPEFNWQDAARTSLAIFWLCFAALALLLFIIAIVMMPGCCSSTWRNCLGWIFCKKCCHDRQRVRPISEIKKWKRSCLWIGGLVGIILLLLFTFLSLAFSIKFFWTSAGAVCQAGRILQEIDHGILYDQSSTESSWMSHSTELSESPWLGLDDLAPRLSESILEGLGPEIEPETIQGAIAIIEELVTEIPNAIRSTVADISDTLSESWILYATIYSPVALSVISALILVGAAFIIVMLILLNRHYKKNTEPRHKVYAIWFTFFWGWFAITGALLLFLGITILTVLSGVSAVCNTARDSVSNVEVLDQFAGTHNWIRKPEIKAAFNACLANEGDGWWFSDGDFEDDILPATDRSLTDILRGAKVGLNCKPLGFSIGSAVDGVCGGIQQDLFWVALGWCLAAGASIWFWIASYKLFHYFKERANESKKKDEPEGEKPLEPSPSALVALAKQRENEELARQLNTVNPQTFRQDTNANTTLHVAAYAGDLEMCERLVNRNAPVDEINKFGFTPLAVAASEGHCKVVGYFIRKGADPTIRDQFGESPLHAAARAGDLAVVEALCQDGAPAPIYRNDEGDVAVDVAAFHDRVDVEAYLDPKTPRSHRSAKSFGLASNPE